MATGGARQRSVAPRGPRGPPVRCAVHRDRRPAGRRGAMGNPVVLEAADSHDRSGMALDALALAVDLYRKGRGEPLPLFASYSPAVHSGSSSDGAWKSHDGTGDATRPAVRLVFGDVDVEEIDDLPPKPGDPDGPGGRVER